MSLLKVFFAFLACSCGIKAAEFDPSQPRYFNTSSVSSTSRLRSTFVSFQDQTTSLSTFSSASGPTSTGVSNSNTGPDIGIETGTLNSTDPDALLFPTPATDSTMDTTLSSSDDSGNWDDSSGPIDNTSPWGIDPNSTDVEATWEDDPENDDGSDRCTECATTTGLQPTTAPVPTAHPSQTTVNLPGRPTLISGTWNVVLSSPTTLPISGITKFLPGLTGSTTTISGQTLVIISKPTTVPVSILVPISVATLAPPQTTLISGTINVVLPGSTPIPLASYLHGQTTLISGVVNIIYSASATVPLNGLPSGVIDRTTVLDSQTFVVLASPTTLAMSGNPAEAPSRTTINSSGKSIPAAITPVAVATGTPFVPAVGTEPPASNSGTVQAPGKSSGSTTQVRMLDVVLVVVSLWTLFEVG